MNEDKILDLVAAIGSTDDMMEIRRIILETIRGIVWFDTANFWLYPPLAQLPNEEHVVLDTPLNALNTYLQHYCYLDEFHQTYNQNSILIARSTDLLNYVWWTKKSEYYYDFLKSNDAHYLLAFDIKDSYMAYGAICFHRSKRNGDFSENDLTALSMIYPHLVNRLRWMYEKQELLARMETYGTLDTHYRYHYFDLLTVREREIAQLVLSGESNQEIARSLGLSVNTVKMHLQNIFTKLGIRRRSQLFNPKPGK